MIGVRIATQCFEFCKMLRMIPPGADGRGCDWGSKASGCSARVFVPRVNEIAELRYKYVGQAEYRHTARTM